MTGTVAVGLQWGDEGKGRFVDVLAAEHDLVVRYQGGHNAGHTLVVDDKTYALQLVPSGVLYDSVTPVIGNGVVVDPLVLLDEMEKLAIGDVDCSRLVLSSQAHLVLDHHRVLDALSEELKGADAIGTTLRGIGPAYADKAARLGVRVEDLLSPDRFRARVAASLAEKNPLLTALGRDPIDLDQVVATYTGEVADRLRPHVGDTVALVNEALEQGRSVLFEGAQATFLDVDHGTYPFVTSSNPVAGAAAVGAGVGPRHLTRVVGIAKAYLTRVGAGPFVTELEGELSDHLVTRGHEFGTNTGRRRRVGWVDLVQLRQAVRLNSLTELAITKLDILDGLESVKLCRSYRLDGRSLLHPPPGLDALERAEPEWIELPGWPEGHGTDLPPAALDFLATIQREVGVPVTFVGVGPDRGAEVRFPEGVPG